MRLQREASVGVGAIFAIQVALSIISITVLMRMGPAIERILEENVYSEAAIEEMLAALARGDSADERDRFSAALRRAEQNITEDAERPLIAAIHTHWEAAMSGAREARMSVVDSLQQLGEVNRASMRRADAEAQRMATAGGWGAAILGGAAFLLAVLIYRRIRLRIEVPLVSLAATTHRVRVGNSQARCALNDAPVELRVVADDINWILDAWDIARREPDTEGIETGEREQDLRCLIARLLDDSGRVAVVLDAEGRRVAASRDALLDGPGVADGEPGDWQATEISDTDLTLYVRAPKE